jgi:hypothetical protein
VLYALWLRYTGPNTTLDFAIMIDILLMVVIGGMGTMYGAVLGATIFVVAQNYLQDLMKLASGAAKGIPLLPDLLHPDRWLLWFGVLFVLSVYYFPARHRRPAARVAHMSFRSRYVVCEGREIHFTEWGAAERRGGDRVARPRAHRARHGRDRRAPRAALSGHLSGYDRARPVAMEPAAGDRVLPRVLRPGRDFARGPARTWRRSTGSARRWAERSGFILPPAR